MQANYREAISPAEHLLDLGNHLLILDRQLTYKDTPTYYYTVQAYSEEIILECKSGQTDVYT